MSATSSILDLMTANVMSRKLDASRAARLTPVGAEDGGPLDATAPETAVEPAAPLAAKQPALPFPYDQPDTVKRAIVNGIKALKDLDEDIDHIRNGLLVLAKFYGLSELEMNPGISLAAQEANTQKAMERAADARFREDFERKQARAKASVFGAPSGTWKCPNGHDSNVERVSKKGRHYLSCTICPEFEKEVR